MQFFRILVILVLIFFSTSSSSQPLWRQYVPQAFAVLEKEVSDSIRVLRQESDTIRANMNAIISEQQLDRISIVGEKDIYIKEGMHKHFVSRPGPSQGNFDRNQQIQKLENLHVELYDADEQLFRWLEFSTILKQHPNRASFDRWTDLWNALPSAERPVLTNTINTWLADQLACDLVSDVRPSVAKNPFEKMQRFNPETDFPKSYHQMTDEWTLPMNAANIIASFPINGQYAFDNTEPLPETGYIFFPESFRWKMNSSALSGNNNYWTRWMSQSEKVKYKLAEWRQNGFFFELPDTLAAGKVYQLDLIALPGGFSRTASGGDKCWDEMRETNAQRKVDQNEKLQGEILITTIYFRAGI